MAEQILLNVGAGHPAAGATLPGYFLAAGWREVRLDIDPANCPDIVGSMLDMSAVASESVDAIYSSHNIEHLFPNELPQAFSEFLRVLKPAGFVVVTCPDLQSAAAMIAQDRLLDIAYESPGGAVTPFDLVYSHRRFTSRDNPFMSHHCGFTLTTLTATLRTNGFASFAGIRRPACFDLWVLATKNPFPDDVIESLARQILPS